MLVCRCRNINLFNFKYMKYLVLIPASSRLSRMRASVCVNLGISAVIKARDPKFGTEIPLCPLYQLEFNLNIKYQTQISKLILLSRFEKTVRIQHILFIFLSSIT